MYTIFLRKYHEIKKAGKWILDETKECEMGNISSEEYYRITCYETRKFFESLGATERVYYKQGRIVKLVSTSPDKTARCVYDFQHR